MDRTKAIAEMEKLRELMLFHAMTGEEIPYETLSQENRDLFDAAGVAIEALKRVPELEKELADERYRHDRYVDFELAEAKELRELREARRWIPVTERKPDMHEETFEDFEDNDTYQVSDWVMCMDSDGDCEVAHLTEYQGDECWVTRDGAEIEVILWMKIQKEDV